MQEALPALKNKFASSDWQDVYNAGKRGLFCKLAPDVTVAMRRSAGHKKLKDHITVLVCANTDESENFSLMFIEAVLQSRPFKKSMKGTSDRINTPTKSMDTRSTL